MSEPEIRRLTRLPGGFDAALEDIAAGLGALYGPAAQAEYERTAPLHFRSAFDHPLVTAYGSFVGAEWTGFIVTVAGPGVTRIMLGHILRPWAGLGHDQALARAALTGAHAAGGRRVLAEFLPFSPFDTGVFGLMGLRAARRAIMLGSAAQVAAHSVDELTEPLEPAHWADAASVLAEAYRDHPGRWLHPEADDARSAREFIESAAAGAYGETPPGSIRAVRRDGRMAGICVGAKAAAGAGFILHAAVLPAYQGRGLGRALVAATAHAFAREGYGLVGLGVTVGNPAERLYERLGFARSRVIEAHAGWARPGGTWSPVPCDVP